MWHWWMSSPAVGLETSTEYDWVLWIKHGHYELWLVPDDRPKGHSYSRFERVPNYAIKARQSRQRAYGVSFTKLERHLSSAKEFPRGPTSSQAWI